MVPISNVSWLALRFSLYLVLNASRMALRFMGNYFKNFKGFMAAIFVGAYYVDRRHTYFHFHFGNAIL